MASMTSPLRVGSDLTVLGAQEPRIWTAPPAVDTLGPVAVELAARAGLQCDPWQEFVAEKAMGIRADGRWAARNVGVVIARQNGKGGLLEVRELAGLFLFEERLLIHSAHEQRTSSEHFLRLRSLIEAVPEFEQRVDRAPKGKGAEAIILKSGARILFVTRTGGGGRGLTADFIAYDEAMILPETAIAALNPTQSAVWNPQTWYTGSAVDQAKHEHGVVLARQRERGLRGSKATAYFEFSAPGDSPDDLSDAEMADPVNWALANPGLGIRIDPEHVENERDGGLSARDFAVERLGVGDWPATDGTVEQVIPIASWLSLVDEGSSAVDPVTFAFDVRPNRGSASIGVAGRRSDESFHTEVVEHRGGTGWVVDRLVDLTGAHTCGPVKCDSASPGAALVPELRNRGVEVELVNATEHGQACGMFFDAVDQRTLRHRNDPELLSALKGAAKRPLGEAWGWSRKSSSVDITPLVACTLAVFGCATAAAESDVFIGVYG